MTLKIENVGTVLLDVRASKILVYQGPKKVGSKPGGWAKRERTEIYLGPWSNLAIDFGAADNWNRKS